MPGGRGWVSVEKGNDMNGQGKADKNKLRGYWREEGMQKLDGMSKMVAWYCLMGPQATGPGMFVLSADVAQRDLNMSGDDWQLYLEEVVEQLGWSYNAEWQVLWIPDWFDWMPPINRRELLIMLQSLSLLPTKAWAAELAAAVPAALAPALQKAWQEFFNPPTHEPAEVADEAGAALEQITDLSQLTAHLIPRLLDQCLRRRTPPYLREAFAEFLREKVLPPSDLATPPAPPPRAESSQIPITSSPA